jgi:NADH:ubiquinone oxidoreductase subunit D
MAEHRFQGRGPELCPRPCEDGPHHAIDADTTLAPDAIEKLLPSFQDEKIAEYETLLTQNRIWLERTRNVGVISGPEAVAIGLSGPPLRASGVRRDVRKDEPYAAYEEFEFDIPLGAVGDTYDRYLVRLEEFRQIWDADNPCLILVKRL